MDTPNPVPMAVSLPDHDSIVCQAEGDIDDDDDDNGDIEAAATVTV